MAAMGVMVAMANWSKCDCWINRVLFGGCHSSSNRKLVKAAIPACFCLRLSRPYTIVSGCLLEKMPNKCLHANFEHLETVWSCRSQPADGCRHVSGETGRKGRTSPNLCEHGRARRAQRHTGRCGQNRQGPKG